MSRISALFLLGRCFRSPKGSIFGSWLILVITASLFAPLIAPFSYDIQNLSNAFAPPAAPHWLGTDEFGRDVLTRILYGARTSLSVSAVAIGFSLAFGMILGAMAGYFGGLFDRIAMILVDLSWSFPEILVALMLVAIIGPGTAGVKAAIAVAYLAQFTRLTRAQVMAIKSETYIAASRSLGASHAFILQRHLIPNVLAPVLVAAMLATGDAMILEATLGFFGLSAQPPTPSWGSMMSAGATLLFKGPWIVLFPGVTVALTVIAINMFGDVLIHNLGIRSHLRDR